MLRTSTKLTNVIALIFASTLLTACGGGGGGSTADDGGGGNPPPSGSGSITLSWVAPATRTDGNQLSLSEVGGYKVYIGTSSGNYNAPVDVGTATTHTFNDLGQGNYYLAVAVYDTNLQDSTPSGEVTAAIN